MREAVMRESVMRESVMRESVMRESDATGRLDQPAPGRIGIVDQR